MPAKRGTPRISARKKIVGELNKKSFFRYMYILLGGNNPLDEFKAPLLNVLKFHLKLKLSLCLQHACLGTPKARLEQIDLRV
jgi:hypothetical protein